MRSKQVDVYSSRRAYFTPASRRCIIFVVTWCCKQFESQRWSLIYLLHFLNLYFSLFSFSFPSFFFFFFFWRNEKEEEEKKTAQFQKKLRGLKFGKKFARREKFISGSLVRVSAVRRLSDTGRWKFSLFSFPPINTRLFGLRMVVSGMYIHTSSLSSRSRRIDLRLGIYFHAASARRRVSYFFARSRFSSSYPLCLSFSRRAKEPPLATSLLYFETFLAEISQAFRIKPAMTPFSFLYQSKKWNRLIHKLQIIL